MQYEWDENKREANLDKHDVDFLIALDFEWQTALVYEDLRSGYDERRFWALGLIQERYMFWYSPAVSSSCESSACVRRIKER